MNLITWAVTPMRMLVTAGPTREFLDPVRFLSNRSSGKMGYALARVAAGRGHVVTLVSGPVCLPPPAGVARVAVTTAEDMLQALEVRLDDCDALIMAAAVADWRPCRFSPQKRKKETVSARLDLEPTPDVLLALAPRKGPRIFVGFAAETERVLEQARQKLARKALDLIVANDVSRPDSGFDVDTNKVTLIPAAGEPMDLPLMSKEQVAERIVAWVETQAALARFP